MAKLTKGYFGGADTEGQTRINKYLGDAGICSRREADALIAAGKVLIDGIPAVMGSKVAPGQKVTVSGREAVKEERLVLIAFHKPQGIVCTADPREPDNIVDYINYGSRIFPIGRLDKDSSGLILLTNDGEIVNKILRAGNGHEKEYIVQVNKPLTPEFLKGMAGGVPILDTVTKPCLVEQLDKMTFRIVLTQGLNRQIRRMCEYFDYHVRALQRVRIMNINLGRLKTGTWRNLTEWELEGLNELLENSSNAPAKDAEERMADENLPPEGIAIVKKMAGKPKKRRDFLEKKGNAPGGKPSGKPYGKKGEESAWERDKTAEKQGVSRAGERQKTDRAAEKLKAGRAGEKQKTDGAAKKLKASKVPERQRIGQTGEKWNSSTGQHMTLGAARTGNRKVRETDWNVKKTDVAKNWEKPEKQHTKTGTCTARNKAAQPHGETSARPKTNIKGEGWTTKKQGSFQKRRTGKR